MAKLGFILGRAGTGKTSALLKEAAELMRSGERTFIIVPEQATFETERRLAEIGRGGVFGCTVASWSGLSRRMLDELGRREAFLSAEGRLMLLRRAADACASRLTVFRRSAKHDGFPAECDSLISRFKRCGFSADDVRRAAESFPEGEPLRDKLCDISVIFGDCERRCADRYIDSEDMMNAMISRMGETSLHGAHVFIDGSDVMHEQAYPAFAALITHAASVTVALEADSGRLFDPARRVFERLCGIADASALPYTVTKLTGRKRASTPALEHLDRELFALSPRVFGGVPEGLSVNICADRADEVAEAAELIVRAAAEGLRFNDIAVTVSDLAGYSGTVSRIFGAYGIPYFTDVKRDLATHPAALLILSALRAAKDGFTPDAVLDIVKTGFLPVTPDEAERFENYILAKGFYGNRLTEPFTGDGAETEPIRQRIMEPLLAFSDALRGGNCETRARAVHGLLETLDVYGQQQKLCERLHEEGRFREEAENAQVVNSIVEVLDQLYVIMGGEEIGLKRFIAVVKEGFASHGIGVIPTTCDQVLVGSMDRTRTREVRLLIVLGMNDGLFPKKRSDDGVIDDGDLKKLKAAGYELWQSTGRLSESDMLTVYSALSKATERIAFFYPISLPASGASDAPASPCRLIGILRRIFPQMPEYDRAASPLPRSNEELAFAALARKLRRMADTGEPDAETAELYSHFSRSPAYRRKLLALTAECIGDGSVPPIGAELASRLYGRSLYGSASRLEAFNSCPFRHFMQYGLKARERDEHREKSTELGIFYHEALQAYVEYVMKNGLDWADIDDDMTASILKKIVPPIMNAEHGHLLYETARQRARLPYVVDSVIFTCCALTRHIARGAFRPLGCEVSFGRADSLFPALRIESGDAVFFISGIIDRIDAAPTSSGRMDRIIDYKTGGKDFDYAELIAGIQLQLPLYAAAAGAAETVGMYYMPVRSVPPTVDENGEAVKRLTEKLESDFRLSGVSLRDTEVIAATDSFDKSSSVIKAELDKNGELKGAGLVDADEFGRVISAAREKAASTLSRIFEGDVGIRPYRKKNDREKNACRSCPYGDICRFDPAAAKGAFREIYPIKPDAFFERNGGQ